MVYTNPAVVDPVALQSVLARAQRVAESFDPWLQVSGQAM